jgi:hypothetical protein
MFELPCSAFAAVGLTVRSDSGKHKGHLPSDVSLAKFCGEIHFLQNSRWVENIGSKCRSGNCGVCCFWCVSGLNVYSYGDFRDLTVGQQSDANRQFLQMLQGKAASHPEEIVARGRNAGGFGFIGTYGLSCCGFLGGLPARVGDD